MGVTKTFLLLNLVLCSVGVPRLESDIVTLEGAKLLSAIIAGPLRHQHSTVLLDVSVGQRVDGNELLRLISHPLMILVGDDAIGKEEIQVESDTLIVIVGSMGYISSLDNPSPSWFIKALVVISVSSNCSAESILLRPLPSRVPDVVLFCPVFHRHSREFISFRAFSWQPYNADHPVVFLGPWDEQKLNNYSDLFVDRFAMFGGTTLHISSNKDDEPLLYLGEDGWEGTNKRIMDMLGKKMNFSYTLIVTASDAEWGELLNGTWIGMLGDVYRGEKHLAVNYFTVTLERANDFDYSVSYYTEGFGFAILIPPPLPPWQNVIFPYSMPMWLAIVLTFLVQSFLFYLLSYFFDEPISLGNAVLDISTGLLSESIIIVPKGWTLRIFLLFWWLGSFIIVIGYTSNLIAVLTIPVLTERIQDIEALAASDYRVCMVDYGEFVPQAMKVSDDQYLRTLGSKLDLVPVTDQEHMGEEACIDKVAANTHAHIETYSYIDILYTKVGLGDKAYVMHQQVYEGNLAFFFTRHTPWKKNFDRGIRAIVEAGLVEKWYIDLMTTMKKSTSYEANYGPSPLTLSHLQGAFMLLATGVFISALAFVVEIFISISKKRMKYY